MDSLLGMGTTTDEHSGQPFFRTPADRARKALDDLYNQVIGLTPLPSGLIRQPLSLPSGSLRRHLPVRKGPDPVATFEYAKLLCDHIEKLNALIPSHRELLLPLSRTRFNWPVLKSTHPKLSEDENEILRSLELGKRTGRYFDKISKWAPDGGISHLVDELIRWARACKHPPGMSIFSAGGGRLRQAEGIDLLYERDECYCPYPVIARLRPQLQPYEKAAAVLESLSKSSCKDWEHLFEVLLTDCFKDRGCADFLRSTFVKAQSRRIISTSKEYLIRKVCERLRTFAGLKK
jgi:hypothetical protein